MAKKAIAVGDEITLQDKIEELNISKDELFPEETGRDEETGEFPQVGNQPRIMAIINSTRKSKLMLYECKNKGVSISTVIPEEKFHEQPLKLIPKIVKDEAAKDNKYQVLYLPISNTDFNKNAKEWNELRGLLQHKYNLSVNFYFEGHDDQEISNRVFAAGIE